RPADALLIEWRCHILGRHGMATGVTLIEGARRQVMANGDPVIEDEAFALPFALLGRHVLEIFQDTALEMVDLFEALPEHEAGGLLAADAAGAEHCHLLVLLRIELLAHILGELAEGPGLRIDRTLEGADGDLV